ncbi:MbtH family protein [Actinomyces sp. Marseille-P3109]|uniref:MbtH family protein n=1 Tax=Actinomyces sp. Marseille-P3109 TaxID=2083009 RepID=UPI000D558D68|nr:MbtH family protein [Actinomyces sp. Marseille-P3109]
MNPFDDDSAKFYVLVNDEEQHSLWPIFAPIPSGWESRFGPVSRDQAMAYVEEAWPDIRPRSLRESTNNH